MSANQSDPFARQSFARRLVCLSELLVLVCAIVMYPASAISSTGASTDAALIAVSSNFIHCFQELEDAFESNTLYEIESSSGSTGKLYAQIQHAAPYHALLAADQLSVQRLVDSGLTVAGSRFTYAVGELVLWSSSPSLAGLSQRPLEEVLRSPMLNKLALANKRLAPYGSAAAAVLAVLGTHPDTILVTGENISQTFQFVYSKNVDAGFVAAAQLKGHAAKRKSYVWPVDSSLHPAIRQDAVLLQRGEHNNAARELLDFVRTKAGRNIIADCGYTGLDNTSSEAAP